MYDIIADLEYSSYNLGENISAEICYYRSCPMHWLMYIMLSSIT